MELIKIRNEGDRDIRASQDGVEYVCRAHATTEIPGRILWKFMEAGKISRVSNRFAEVGEVVNKSSPPASPAPQKETKPDPPPAPPVPKATLQVTDESTARQMAREDATLCAGSLGIGNVKKPAKPARTVPRKSKGKRKRKPGSNSSR